MRDKKTEIKIIKRSNYISFEAFIRQAWSTTYNKIIADVITQREPRLSIFLT